MNKAPEAKKSPGGTLWLSKDGVLFGAGWDLNMLKPNLYPGGA